MQVKVKKINNGCIPVFKRDGDACADCYSNISVAIASKSRVIVPLGFALEIPEGYEGVIRPRSGMTSKEIDAELSANEQAMFKAISNPNSYDSNGNFNWDSYRPPLIDDTNGLRTKVK